MKLGRWESSSVFAKFYKKSKVARFTSEEITLARAAEEETGSESTRQTPQDPHYEEPARPPAEAQSPAAGQTA